MCGRFEVKDPFEKTIMLFHCVVVFATFLAVNAAALGQQTRNVDGQSGCLFDGRVYAPNEMITIPKCLGEMRCLGSNNYSPITPLYGNCQNKRAFVDGQSGCLFDGRVYAPNEMITIPKCLGEMRCLGNNNYSPITPLYGNCQNKRASVDGQTGCLFDGKVYAPNEEIIIPKCLAKFTCLGNNNYSNLISLGGVC